MGRKVSGMSGGQKDPALDRLGELGARIMAARMVLLESRSGCGASSSSLAGPYSGAFLWRVTYFLSPSVVKLRVVIINANLFEPEKPPEWQVRGVVIEEGGQRSRIERKDLPGLDRIGELEVLPDAPDALIRGLVMILQKKEGAEAPAGNSRMVLVRPVGQIENIPEGWQLDQWSKFEDAWQYVDAQRWAQRVLRGEPASSA